MAEYIDREALLRDARQDKAIGACLADIVDIQNLINDQPAADVALVVHGHIVPAEQPKKVLLDGKCVKCNSLMLSTDKFCPSCGARMDGE